jgi:uncharacterized membrane protein YeaQ/YmgE (transglycosylase-associated protein family)
MSLIHLLLYLLVAFLCGLFGQAIARRSLGGLIITTFLGLIGAIVGAWMARALHLPEPLWIHVGGRPFAVVWSVIGAATVTFLVSLALRSRR